MNASKTDIAAQTIAALGLEADDFDVDAIIDEAWDTFTSYNEAGELVYEDDADAFWAIVFKHALNA